jgi:hypothetical protein
VIDFGPRSVDCLGSNPTALRFFQRRDFLTSFVCRSSNPPCGKTFESKETIKVTTLVVVPPAPLGEPFFHKETWNCYIKNSLTDPPVSLPLNSHTHLVGVIQKPDVPARFLHLGKGRQVIPPPRDDQSYTPTQSSSDSPASSKAEAS